MSSKRFSVDIDGSEFRLYKVVGSVQNQLMGPKDLTENLEDTYLAGLRSEELLLELRTDDGKHSIVEKIEAEFDVSNFIMRLGDEVVCFSGLVIGYRFISDCRFKVAIKARCQVRVKLTGEVAWEAA